MSTFDSSVQLSAKRSNAEVRKVPDLLKNQSPIRKLHGREPQSPTTALAHAGANVALLNRERVSRKDAGYTQLITIFVRHRAEIERLALAKLLREGHSSRGVVVTTEDLNP